MSAVRELLGAQVRPMEEADLRVVLDIERAAYRYPWSEDIFRDCLRVGYCCWVAERARGVNAYGIMSVAAQECHILNLCVDPASRREGLGRALLDHLLELARVHRADTAFLEVRPSNREALALYASRGFSEVGVRRGYYPGERGREDALILALPIAGMGMSG